ncbi:MAG TPA: beta-1,6-N-acetylglucosaminyltransferase [Puia sp.]|uniref:beta-1,6-N-acetylglucosaminyltransferase n=1 Tax=Puia sp. TaxID=2045100 RepID=UPI002C4D827F|nr:beta-1,6-N-acetylglucosaminyltransferase [Puia sp.]HVU95080.1 beta-1,6-N-acetylglucosaminyltransferase [Puia sp.]
MRIAHLILTHKKDPAQLERLIDALRHPSCDIFIHLDRKTPIDGFLHLAQKPNIVFIKRRIPVYWAGYGTVQATLNGFVEILKKDRYDYVNVISGQDFPIQSQEQFLTFLRKKNSAEFITCESIEDKWKAAAPRVMSYHLINWRIPGKFKLEKLINRILPKRRFPLNYSLVGRSNWFTISADAVKYILDFVENNPSVVRYFKYCWGADELIFSTILYNSPFRQRIEDNLTYVDWTGRSDGHPRILDKADFQKIISSGKFFARKLDLDYDSELVNLLEKEIATPKRQLVTTTL